MRVLDKLSPDTDATTEITYRSRHRTWAGHGSGAACDLCRDPITREEIEYEVEESGKDSIRMHFACYQRWVMSG